MFRKMGDVQEILSVLGEFNPLNAKRFPKGLPK